MLTKLRGACPIALFATAGFAIFETMLDRLLTAVDPATLFALRAAVTLPILIVALRLCGRSLTAELQRLGTCPLHWSRGLAWSTTAFLTILAFWNTASVTETYALMLLHPFWTVALTGTVAKDRQDWRPYKWPFVLLFAGLLLYGFGDGIDLESPWSYLAPIAAGAAFALTNLVGVRIKRELAHDALTKNVASVLSALVVAPLVLGVFPLLVEVEPRGAVSLDMLPLGLLVVGAAGVALLANIGITHAFDCACNSAVIAAIDSAIIVMGLGLDWLFNPAFDVADYLGMQGIGMVAMTAGAIWAAVRLEGGERHPAPVRRTPQLRPAVRPGWPASGLYAARTAGASLSELHGNPLSGRHRGGGRPALPARLIGPDRG